MARKEKERKTEKHIVKFFFIFIQLGAHKHSAKINIMLKDDVKMLRVGAKQWCGKMKCNMAQSITLNCKVFFTHMKVSRFTVDFFSSQTLRD
jgi:hypothetical protein